MMHASRSKLRGGVCPLTRQREAISPKSKRNWEKLIPPSPACNRWLRLRMILITLRISRGFLGMPVLTANSGIGASGCGAL